MRGEHGKIICITDPSAPPVDFDRLHRLVAAMLIEQVETVPVVRCDRVNKIQVWKKDHFEALEVLVG